MKGASNGFEQEQRCCRLLHLAEYYESQFAILPARKNVSVTAAENTCMDLCEAKRACEYFQKFFNKDTRFGG